MYIHHLHVLFLILFRNTIHYNIFRIQKLRYIAGVERIYTITHLVFFHRYKVINVLHSQLWEPIRRHFYIDKPFLQKQSALVHSRTEKMSVLLIWYYRIFQWCPLILTPPSEAVIISEQGLRFSKLEFYIVLDMFAHIQCPKLQVLLYNMSLP